MRDAAVIRTLKEAHDYSADNVSFDIDYNRVIARKTKVVDTLREGVAALLKRAKVNVVDGMAKFKNNTTIIVNGEEYDADNIIIATGSRSKSLPIPGADQEWVLDSTKILDLEFVPESLVIVGGGVIGMEFASIFNAMGTKVTVIEYMKQILPPFDSDIAKRLKQAMAKQGVEIITGAAVKRMEQNSFYQIETTYELKGEEKTVTSSNVLMAVGRAANVEGLDLEVAGVEYSLRGIAVNDNMQTNVPNIYAIGDVNARMMLAHVATAQGKRALNHICGVADGINLNVVPSAVFTYPECGMAGLTEEECKARGMKVEIGKGFYRANGKALALGEPEGLCKLIFDAETECLVGAHVMGAEAALITQQCADMITYRKTRHEIADTIFGHPTLSEVILAAVE